MLTTHKFISQGFFSNSVVQNQRLSTVHQWISRSYDLPFPRKFQCSNVTYKELIIRFSLMYHSLLCQVSGLQCTPLITYTYIDSILKSRDITLPTKVRLVKAMVFPVVMYGCQSWTVKKAECRRIDAFELWCWRRLLRGPWTARRSNQSILKEISPGCSLVGLMLKLRLQYFGHLLWRADSFEKTLMLGKIKGRRRSGWQRMRWLYVITEFE